MGIIKFNIIVPKQLLSQQILQDSIALKMKKKTAPEVKILFRKTVYGWKNKPSFRQKLTRREDYISERIWADGNNAYQYQLVNFGTIRHRIPKYGSTLLKFKWNYPGSYKASSSPGVIQSKRHYKTGPVRTFMSVMHPGFKPREFAQTIAKEYRPTFIKDMMKAMADSFAKTAQKFNNMLHLS